MATHVHADGTVHEDDHRKTNEGQLRPLSKRLSPAKQEKRALKIAARATVAQALANEAGITRGISLSIAAVVKKQQTRLNVLTVALVLAYLALIWLALR